MQFKNTPNRLNIQGVNVSDIWKDVTLEVWDRWCKFTETKIASGRLFFGYFQLAKGSRGWQRRYRV